MRNALLTGAFCVCTVLASGSVSAESANPACSEGATSPAALQHTHSVTLSPSLLNDFAIGYLLGGGVAAGGQEVLESMVSDMAANYAHNLNSLTACQDAARAEPGTPTANATARQETAWPLSDLSTQLQQQLKSFSLHDYLPDFQVTVHEVSTEDTFSMRVVPSPDGSLIRVVRSPGR